MRAGATMKLGYTEALEVQVLDDGAIRVRRKDRKPMTSEDHEIARRIADSLAGIVVEDVMRVFPGAKVAQS